MKPFQISLLLILSIVANLSLAATKTERQAPSESAPAVQSLPKPDGLCSVDRGDSSNCKEGSTLVIRGEDYSNINMFASLVASSCDFRYSVIALSHPAARDAGSVVCVKR